MQGWKTAYRPTGQSRDGKIGGCGRAESGARKGLGVGLLGCVGGARFGIAVTGLRLRAKTLAGGDDPSRGEVTPLPTMAAPLPL